jgi:adenylate cyclase
MRIGIRLAVSLLVLVSITVAALGVHVLWWRTAQANSRTLVATINAQIVSAVEKEISSLASQARAAQAAIHTLFLQNVLETREADKREFVFLAQLQSQPALSWIAFGWPDGTFFAAHKLGDERLEMMEISEVDGVRMRRTDRYLVLGSDTEFEQRRFDRSDYRVTEQEWYRAAIARDTARWYDVELHPDGVRSAIAFAGPIDVFQKREGVLAVGIEHTRLSRFLSQLSVGRSGAAFILGPNGRTIAMPDAEADEVHPHRPDAQPLLAAASEAARAAEPLMDASPRDAREMRQKMGSDAYAVTLTPLAFPGWTLATVIPEAEFLASIDETIRRLILVLAVLVVGAALLSAWLARQVIAGPLVKVAGELARVEKFELDAVRQHASRLSEIDNLSRAIVDMARGLSAFRKYIPADLVKTLVAHRIDVKPGGSIEPMTVMFADIAGFTGMSERLGDRVVPILGQYFDLMSREICAHGGTIDKFIGDAVMAFWGAPVPDPEHAANACRAALACQRAIRSSDLRDDGGRPLRIRIGINSGNVLVGNIGSDVRLNYTVIGDAVNVASRLEGANKQYGSNIIIGPETRRLTGDGFHVRELDSLTVHGRMGALQIYELLAEGGSGAARPGWATLYEAGLEAYRADNFEAAVGFFQMLLSVRPGDGPARLMIERCRRPLGAPTAVARHTERAIG